MRYFLLMLVAAVLPAGSADSQLPLYTIPFTVHSNGIYFSVRVNGSRPLQFQFDSAAGVHIINWNRALELKLPMEETAARATGGGDSSTRAAIISNARFRIGDFELPQGRTAAVNLDAVIQRKGVMLDGLIGADLLKRYVVEVDTGTGLMRLYDPATWTYKGSGEHLPLRVDGAGQPYLQASIVVGKAAPVEGEFLIDSGAAESTIMLASPFATKHALLESIERSGAKLLLNEMLGVGGTSRIWTVRVDEVRLGANVFPRPVVDISGAKGGTLAKSDIAGIIGGGFLHRFRLIYDCPHRALYLEPTSRLQTPFEREMAGLRWLVSGPSLNQFRVLSVTPDSPAAKAGVAPGDTLVSIDGKQAESFNKQSLMEYLQHVGRKVTLLLTRDGRNTNITFVLERLV